MYNTEYVTQSLSNTGGSTNATDGLVLMMESMGALFGVILMAMLIGCLIAYAIYAIVLGKIFKKAGVKPSIAWVPFYNCWKLLELGDQKGYWVLFMLFPPTAIVTTIFMYIAMYHIGKKFGKEDWFLALAILVTPVWFLILAFDKSVWNGEKTVAPETPTPTNVAPVAPAIAEPTNDDPVATPEAPAYSAPMTEAPVDIPSEPVYTVPETAAPVEAQTSVTPEPSEAQVVEQPISEPDITNPTV